MRLITAARAAVQSGRYVTGWTFAASLVISFTVLAPTVGGSARQAVLAGVATWLSLAAALVVVALAERRLSTPARGLAVVGGIALSAAARPLVQDAWVRAVGAVPPPAWQMPFRIGTNAATLLVLFTAIAILVDAVRSLRTTNALLQAAVVERARVDRWTVAFEARARGAVRAAADDLAAASAALARGGGVADVRAFAAGPVRAASHGLADLADRAFRPAADEPAVPTVPAASAAPTTSGRPTVRTRLPVLSIPPRWVVPVVYVACVLPFALRTAPLAEVVAGILLAFAGGMVVDAGIRRRGVRRRVAVFVAASVVCGVVLTLFSLACAAAWGSDAWGSRTALAGLVHVAIAVGAAACAGTLRALRVEQRRLAGVVAAAQRSGRSGTTGAREALSEAAELLHRDVQGRCAVFALSHESSAGVPAASAAAARAELLEQITSTLTRVGDVFARERRAEPVSLDGIVATWGRVIALDVVVSPEAGAVLDAGSQAARDAYDVVAEGVLNAVKHTAERRADVVLDVVPTGAGRVLRVRVRSYGPVRTAPQLRPASRVAGIGAALAPAPGGAEGAVLQALIELPASLPSSSVASTEHPARPRSATL